MRLLSLVFVAATLLSGCSIQINRPALSTLPESSYRVIDEDNDRLEVELTAPATIKTTSLEPGSRITFNKYSKEVSSLSSKAKTSFAGIALPEDSRITLGEFVTVTLGRPAKYGNVEFAAGDVVRFKFDRTDVPHFATLAGPHTIGGKTYADGDEVRFNLIGEVTSAKSASAREREDRERAAKRRLCAPACAGLEGVHRENCITRCGS